MSFVPGARSIKILGLTTGGHFFSHFYYLALYAAFPLLKDDLGVDYTGLGFAITAYSAATALGQTPVGIIVDRHGPAIVFAAGLALSSISIALIGAFPHYGVFIALMIMAGAGDSVFHPAGYTILSNAIAPARLGRAFSWFNFSGQIGFAAAPMLTITSATWFGWRTTLTGFGIIGLAVAMLLFTQRRLLGESLTALPGKASRPRFGRHDLAFLLSVPLLMGLLFFIGLNFATTGVRDFGVAAVHVLYQAPLSDAGWVVSMYLIAAPVGVIAGGWIADHTKRHDLVAVTGLCMLAFAALAIAIVHPVLPVAAVLLAVAGFFVGMIAPSRDMIIKNLAPPEQTGKTFGFVSVGISIGGICAPPVFGFLLDHAPANSVLWAAGAFSIVTIVGVLAAGEARSRRVATLEAPRAAAGED